MFSRAVLREAGVVLVASLLLGLSYNALSGKGIFGPDRERIPVPAPSASSASSEIIPVEIAKSLFDTQTATFVDTRHAYDYNLGHIKGAINVPLTEADSAMAAFGKDKSRTIVVYCDGAECNSSLEVGAKFVMAGHTDVRIFYAGWQSWNGLGYPTDGAAK
jgi:rhodanese-related sulfurtransferase